MQHINLTIRENKLHQYLFYPEKDKLYLYKLLEMKRKDLLKEAKQKGVWRISRLSRYDIVLKLFTHYLYYDSDRFKDNDPVDEIDEDFTGPEFMIIDKDDTSPKSTNSININDIKKHAKTPKYNINKTIIADMNKPNPINFQISFD